MLKITFHLKSQTKPTITFIKPDEFNIEEMMTRLKEVKQIILTTDDNNIIWINKSNLVCITSEHIEEK